MFYAVEFFDVCQLWSRGRRAAKSPYVNLEQFPFAKVLEGSRALWVRAFRNHGMHPTIGCGGLAEAEACVSQEKRATLPILRCINSAQSSCGNYKFPSHGRLANNLLMNLELSLTAASDGHPACHLALA